GSIQTKKEFLASVKASNAQEQQVAPEALKVNVHGNVAIASGVLRVKGVRRETLHAPGALRRHLAAQGRELGMHRHQCHAHSLKTRLHVRAASPCLTTLPWPITGQVSYHGQSASAIPVIPSAARNLVLWPRPGSADSSLCSE